LTNLPNQSNTAHPKYERKFQSIAEQFHDVNILDPYHFPADEYIKNYESH